MVVRRRQLNNGRTNVHDEARSGRTSVYYDLAVKVNEKTLGNRKNAYSCVSTNFRNHFVRDCHKSLIYYKLLCSCWVPYEIFPRLDSTVVRACSTYMALQIQKTGEV